MSADTSTHRELVRELCDAAKMSATRAAATLLRGGAGRAGPSLLPLPRALALRGPLGAARRFCATEAAAAPLSPKVQQLVDEIAGLTLLEASELTEALKEKLGITTAMAMPMPAAGAAPAAGGGGAAAAPAAEEAPAAEAKTHFTVKLEKFDPATKIKLIKEVRAATGLGLKEAKEAVEGAPKELKADVKKEEAEELKAKLEAVGGTVTIE